MIVFDEQRNLSKVERYDQTTGITTLLSLSNFDLFDLGAEVGDSMCFGYGNAQGGSPWHNLYLSISTALDIDATLTWYVLASHNNWVALTITTDGTNGFTQSGWIEFDCPPQMNMGTQTPGYLAFAIKCEITAFTSITTVGHVNATPQINDFIIEVTGTETMTSIKAANDSGSWGVVDQDGDRYKIWCNLYLNGSLTSLNELVEIGDENVGRYFYVSAIGVLQLGDEAGNGKSIDGSIWRYTNNAGAYPFIGFRGTLKMYVSEFYNDSIIAQRDMYFYSTSVLYFKDSIFRTQREKWLYGSLTVINSVLWTPIRHFIGAATSVLDNAKFIMNNIWSAPNVSFTIKNTDLSASYLIIVPYGAASIVTMEDCDLGDDLGAKVNPWVNGTGIVKFNLNLTINNRAGDPISEPNLKVEDSYGTVIYDGVYSGGNILLEVYKKIEVSSVPTIYDYNPFVITIKKDFYQDYIETVDVLEKIDKIVSMVETIYFQQMIDGEISEDAVTGGIAEDAVGGDVAETAIDGGVSDEEVFGTVETVEISGTIS